MLSQTVGYAIIAMGYLAEQEDGGPVLVKEISAATGVPSAYLAKIVNTLSRKGLVNTQRGIRGGVTLARPANAVSVYDLCKIFDDPVCEDRCMLGLAQCTDERACPAHEYWKAQRTQSQEYLANMTLADVGHFEAGQRRKRGGVQIQVPVSPSVGK